MDHIPNVGVLNQDALKASLKTIGEIKDGESQNKKFLIDEEDLIHALRREIAREFFSDKTESNDFKANLKKLEKDHLPVVQEGFFPESLKEKIRNSAETEAPNKVTEVVMFVTGLAKNILFLKSRDPVLGGKKIEAICWKKEVDKVFKDYKFKPCDELSIAFN